MVFFSRMPSAVMQVTVIAATEGTFQLPEIKSTSDLRNALTLLGSIPVDELQVFPPFIPCLARSLRWFAQVKPISFPLQAVEVLWTPQDDQDTLTARELLEDYPLLRSI